MKLANNFTCGLEEELAFIIVNHITAPITREPYISFSCNDSSDSNKRVNSKFLLIPKDYLAPSVKVSREKCFVYKILNYFD